MDLHGEKVFKSGIVPLMSGNLAHGTIKMVPLNESSTCQGFHLSEEINKDLLKQIQGTEGNGST